jgi:hypothetical protein
MEECKQCETCLFIEQCTLFEKFLSKMNCDEYIDINNFDNDEFNREENGWNEMSYRKYVEKYIYEI